MSIILSFPLSFLSGLYTVGDCGCIHCIIGNANKHEKKAENNSTVNLQCVFEWVTLLFCVYFKHFRTT